MKYRIYKWAAFLALGLGGFVGTASAQDWPSRPVTMVVPFPPGGVVDVTARLVARQLADEIKQNVIVENKPGAGASIGATFVARAKPDGYTLLVATLANMVVNSYVYKESLNYDPINDFKAVHGLSSLPLVIVTRSESAYKSLDDMLKAARQAPGTITYGSAGIGTVSQLSAELLQAQTHTRLLHVPYKGSAPVITDLLGENLDVAFDYASTTLPHIRSGKLRPLAVTGAERLPLLPDVPTVGEAGFPNTEVTAWLGVFAPANTPAAIVQALDKAMASALRASAVTEGVAGTGATVWSLDSQQLGDFVAQEHRRWKPVIESIDIPRN